MFRKDGGCLLAHTNHLARGRVRSFASPGREIPTRRERTGTRYGGVLGPATSAKRKTIAARRDRRGAPRGKFGKEPAKDDVRCFSACTVARTRRILIATTLAKKSSPRERAFVASQSRRSPRREPRRRPQTNTQPPVARRRATRRETHHMPCCPSSGWSLMRSSMRRMVIAASVAN